LAIATCNIVPPIWLTLEVVTIVDFCCVRMMQFKTWNGGKGTSRHKQRGASWLTGSTYPVCGW